MRRATLLFVLAAVPLLADAGAFRPILYVQKSGKTGGTPASVLPIESLVMGETMDAPDWRLRLKWSLDIGLTTFRTTIQHVGDSVIVGSNGASRGAPNDALDGVWVLNAADGTIRQVFISASDGDCDVNGVATDGVAVFFGDDDGDFYAYDLDGSLLWEVPGEPDADYEGAPALADLNGDQTLDVIAATETGMLRVFDGATGEIVWERPSPPAADDWLTNSYIASPAVFDLNDDSVPDVVIGSRGGWVAAFNGRDGELLWKRVASTPSGVHASPLILQTNAGTRILVAEAYGTIHLLDAKGKLTHQWEMTNPTGGIEGVFSTPIPTPDGILVVGCSWWGKDDGIWCFPAFSAPKDAKSKGGPIVGRPTVDEPGVYYRHTGRVSATPFIADILGLGEPQVGVVAESGEMTLFSSAGEPMGRVRFPGPVEATPLITDVDGDGELELIVAAGKRLYCYSTGSRGAVPWGSFRGDPMNSGVMLYRDVRF